MFSAKLQNIAMWLLPQNKPFLHFGNSEAIPFKQSKEACLLSSRTRSEVSGAKITVYYLGC